MNIQIELIEAGFQVQDQKSCKSSNPVNPDERMMGYGLNFIGRNVAKAKYAQKTAKELKYSGQWTERTTHYPLKTCS